MKKSVSMHKKKKVLTQTYNNIIVPKVQGYKIKNNQKNKQAKKANK